MKVARDPVAAAAALLTILLLCGCPTQQNQPVLESVNDPAAGNVAPMPDGNQYAPAPGEQPSYSPADQTYPPQAYPPQPNQSAPPGASGDAAPGPVNPEYGPAGPPPYLAAGPNQGYGNPGDDGPDGDDQGYGDQGYDDQGYGDQPYDDQDYDDYGNDDYQAPPGAYAPAPPPPLPEYEQPPCPGDGYLWTPGFWAYDPDGYYWTPGAWVMPPFLGALWTPGYWSLFGASFAFHPGYWGPYIGFYGGIPYGFGYTGEGYQGGYWNHDNFFYNTTVNNIQNTRITNIYRRNVIGNNVGFNRMSYNGPGGVQARPTLADIAAARAPHVPAMSQQVEQQRLAANNPAQFASVNHGRPALLASQRPLAADRNIRAPRAQAVRASLQGTARRFAPQQAQRAMPTPGMGSPGGRYQAPTARYGQPRMQAGPTSGPARNYQQQYGRAAAGPSSFRQPQPMQNRQSPQHFAPQQQFRPQQPQQQFRPQQPRMDFRPQQQFRSAPRPSFPRPR